MADKIYYYNFAKPITKKKDWGLSSTSGNLWTTKYLSLSIEFKIARYSIITININIIKKMLYLNNHYFNLF